MTQAEQLLNDWENGRRLGYKNFGRLVKFRYPSAGRGRSRNRDGGWNYPFPDGSWIRTWGKTMKMALGPRP